MRHNVRSWVAVRGILGVLAIALMVSLSGCASKAVSGNTSSPDLAIVAGHTGTVTAGGNATLTLAVNNAGTAATTGTITVTDTLPAGLAYSSVSGAGWNCSAAGQTVTCTNPGPIAAGAAATTATLTVAVGANATGPISNTASVSTTGDANAANNSSTDPNVAVLIADLGIVAGHTGTVTVGSNATLTLAVNNAGTGATPNAITVTDTLPAGLTYSSFTGASWNCSAVGQAVTCTDAGPIASNAAAATINLTVAVSVTATGPLSNTGTVATVGDTNAANNSSTDANFAVLSPDLMMTTTHVGSPAGGSPATYNLVVKNVGTAATFGTITVTDTLPAALAFTSATGAGWNCPAPGGQTVTCTNAGPLASGATASTISLVVGVAANASGAVANTASVATSGDTNNANNSQTDSVTFAPSIAVSKVHVGSSFTAGTNGSYTITVTNNGNGATTGTITVTDTLAAGLTYVSGTGTGWGCGAALQVVTCTNNAPVLPNASAAALTLTVGVGGAISGSINNSATATTAGSPNATSTTDTVTVNLIDLSITKTHNGTFAPGNSASYTLAVTNVGNAATSGTITVTDTLPASLSFSSGTGAGWTCNAASQTVTCTNPGPIAGGASDNITLNVTVSSQALGAIVNTASISVAGDNNPVNDSSTDTVVVNNCLQDPTKHGSESLLNGQYTFFAHGLAGSTSPGTPVAVAASFAADGAGNITDLGGGDGGDLDINQASGYTHVVLASSGSAYTVYPDPHGSNAGFLGCVVLNSASQGTRVFRFALNNISGGVAAGGHIIEFDDVQNNGNANHVSGPLRLQDKSAFTGGNTNQLKTDYAFGLDGIDPSNNHFGVVGHLVLNPATGAITNSDVDSNDAGGTILTNATGGTGAISGISALTGRGTLTITPTGGSLATDVVYIVSPKEMFLMGKDTLGSGNAIDAGMALATGASNSFGDSSVSGTYVYRGTGISNCSGSPCGQVNLALVTLNNTGSAITGTTWDFTSNNASINTSPLPGGSTYSVDPTFGRMTVTAGSNPPVFYLVTSATDGITAFAVDGSTSATFALLEAQQPGPYTTASLATNYIVGTEDLSDNAGDVSLSVFKVDTSGNVTGTSTDSSQGGQFFDANANNIPFQLAINSDGTGTFDPGSLIITTGTNIFWVESGGPAEIIVFERQ